MARYQLILPDSIYEELKDRAKKEGETIRYKVMQYIRLGLLVNQPGASVVVETHDGKSTRVIL